MPRAASAQSQLPLRDRPLLILLDGHAIVHRAWHAIRTPMTVGRTGEEVRAVYGFVSTLLKALQDFSPTHAAITFDRPTPTFRHQAFRDYKAQRPPAPPELRQQFERVRQMVQAFGMPIFEVDGFEADDVLGALCQQAEAKNVETYILTGDTDTLQLVTPLVRVVLSYRIQERIVFDEAQVAERYGGLRPDQLAHFKALRGDPSDNIPGVPGIGEKTAIKLLLDYGTVQGIYERLPEVPEKLRDLLARHRELVFRGLALTTIVRQVPVTLDLEACRFWRYDRSKVVDALRELEFVSLVPRVPESAAPSVASAPQEAAVGPKDYRLIPSLEELGEVVRSLQGVPLLAFDTETTGQDAMRCDLVGLSLCGTVGKAYYVSVGHQDFHLDLRAVLDKLRPLLEIPGLPKVAHNANFDATVLANSGIAVQGLKADSMVAAFLVGKKALGLKELAVAVLGEEMTPISQLIGSGSKQITMAQVPAARAADYASADADMTLRLWQALEPELAKANVAKVFYEVEMPLVPVLVQMQLNGIAVDVALLGQMGATLGEQLRRLEAEAYNAVGHQFNLNSPRQLGEVLFQELKLPKSKRTASGGYTTDAAALEALRGAHPVIEHILEYRQLSKLKSTYVDALPQLVNPRTGRLHTSYNQTGAVTGRVSSSEPNLQNIPIRTELGKQIRRAFIPGERGWLLLAADYSQIELRVLAHLSRDPKLMEAFFSGLDIHAATASQVFHVPLEQVTSDQRRLAKVLNFGVIYGLSAYGISQQTSLSTEEGAQFIEGYLGTYPGVRAYIEETKRKARGLGYVETALGRRRYIPEVNAANGQVRAAAEREAINMPVQGTAADIMKLAMIKLYDAMAQEKLRSRMLLQVHDELIWEVPPQEVEVLKGMVQEMMPSALPLSVPLAVAVKMGANWGELE
ncbi:MAG: DNA polymerase I [Chloroflexi bacterium]|nr:DNA polymerase I [Chloroflexota bacterium]